MDSLLVPGRCHFYISVEENASPFDPRLAIGESFLDVPGWKHLGHTSRSQIFGLEQIDPNDEEQEIFEEYESMCHRPTYWKFLIPLISFDSNSWEVIAPGGKEAPDLEGYSVSDPGYAIRSVTAVFEDGGKVSGVYFRRVKLRGMGGFSLELSKSTELQLTGYVMKPDVDIWGKFYLFKSRGM